MGVHGGAQELIVAVDVASGLLLLIGVYLGSSGLLQNGFAAAVWTLITLAPILFGAARFLGVA